MSKRKTVLVVSYGPVPTPEYQTIEGGGMRAWGIAKGLTANDCQVTVAVNQSFPQSCSTHEDIQLANWTEDDAFISLINSFDAVVISYCMGGTSVFVADNIHDNVTLILDAYVPIYIEVAARNSDDKRTELLNYELDMSNANHVLQRGDYFLCANLPQKHMYTGILSSMSIINPVTYSEERVLVVPFGVESETIAKLTVKKNPYRKLGIREGDFVLLWFGGLYPWFNFTPLVESVITLSQNPRFKFVLVGGKNPYNQHPDFTKQYDFVHDFFSKSGLIGKSVFLVDWVDFADRVLWFRGADAVISINQEGEENDYSWRTRVIDYVGNELPMLTNGGDPLSEELIMEHAALRIDTTQAAITKAVQHLMNKPSDLADMKMTLQAVRKKYYWTKVVRPIIEKLSSAPLPYAAFKETRVEMGLGVERKLPSTLPHQRSRVDTVRHYYGKAREKGIVRSAKLATRIGYTLAASKLKRASAKPGSQRVILLSHPIDETGAPKVLLDIAYDFAEHMPPRTIHIVAPDIKEHLLVPLRKKHFAIHKMAMGLNNRLIHAQLQIQPNDFVLMNTVALYPNYRAYVFWLLETGKLNRANWFIHEDNPALQFQNKQEIGKIKSLIAKGLLQLYVPSSQTASEYNVFFDTTTVRSVDLKADLPQKLAKPRLADDFGTISFVVSGSPWDGRKGQFLFVNALLYFEKYLRKSHSTYRPYNVNLLALSDDYISKQLIAVGTAFWGDDCKTYTKLPREESLAITRTCNVTVCVSLNETFALFVAEGMAMGHPIIRNRSSGWKEQIKNNKNGYLFDNLNVRELAEKLELILNKEKTSNEQLATMGRESQAIAQRFTNANYYTQIYEQY